MPNCGAVISCVVNSRSPCCAPRCWISPHRDTGGTLLGSNRRAASRPLLVDTRVWLLTSIFKQLALLVIRADGNYYEYCCAWSVLRHFLFSIKRNDTTKLHNDEWLHKLKRATRPRICSQASTIRSSICPIHLVLADKAFEQ